MLADIRTRLASYVNCNATDLVMVENASSGANAVLRSIAMALNLQRGDKILIMNVAYPMVTLFFHFKIQRSCFYHTYIQVVNVCNYLAQEMGLVVVTANLTWPITSPQQVLSLLTSVIQANPGIKIASFDWISSYPAILLPVQQMVALMKQYSIFTFIDAAHVLGHVPMDLTQLGADALTANAHKWMYSPKSGAILYVAPKWQSMIQPSVISSEFANSVAFADKFAYTGTRSYNAMIAVDSAMDFRESLGDAAIMAYIKQLAWDGAQACLKVWNTTLIVPNPDMNTGIIDVVLPTQNPSSISAAASGLMSKYSTYIQTGSFYGTFYIRLSAQIFLEVSDFELLAQRFLEFI